MFISEPEKDNTNTLDEGVPNNSQWNEIHLESPWKQREPSNQVSWAVEKFAPLQDTALEKPSVWLF